MITESLMVRCELAETEPLQRIVMDDIGAVGFKTADRMVGLDQAHVDLVLEKLAQFHAASAVHFEKVGQEKIRQ